MRISTLFINSCKNSTSDRIANLTMGLKLETLLEALKKASQEISKPVVFILDGLDGIKLHEQKDFE